MKYFFLLLDHNSGLKRLIHLCSFLIYTDRIGSENIGAEYNYLFLGTVNNI